MYSNVFLKKERDCRWKKKRFIPFFTGFKCLAKVWIFMEFCVGFASRVCVCLCVCVREKTDYENL